MRDARNLISAEDLLEIFSKVTLEYQKKVRKKGSKRETDKITKAELLYIFKKCGKIK